MYKKCLSLLLLFFFFLSPTLVFSNIGDTKDTLIKRLHQPPADTQHFDSRTEMLAFTDGHTHIIIGMLDGKSTIESYFDKDGAEINQDRLVQVLTMYGEKWVPQQDETGRTVLNQAGTIKISYGDIFAENLHVRNALTIVDVLNAPTMLKLMKDALEHPSTKI